MSSPSAESDSTLAYYSAHAAEYAARTDAIDMSPLYAKFDPLLSAGSLVLDLGCGGGRDARHFASLGHQVIAIDPCPEILTEAQRRTTSDLGQRIRYRVGSVPGLPLPDSCSSAIWACASLLHLPRSAMALAVAECSRILLPGGVFLISVKRGTGEAFDDGRLFTYWQMDELTRIVQNGGFTFLNAGAIPSVDGRDTTWLYIIAQKLPAC